MTARNVMMNASRISQARIKLAGSVRLAKACNRDYLETKDRRYLQIRNEAMGDARYWRGVLLR